MLKIRKTIDGEEQMFVMGVIYQPKYLNEYIRDYFNYGVDWDDTSKEELWEQRIGIKR